MWPDPQKNIVSIHTCNFTNLNIGDIDGCVTKHCISLMVQL